jgi:hypothetical protein
MLETTEKHRGRREEQMTLRAWGAAVLRPYEGARSGAQARRGHDVSCSYEENPPLGTQAALVLVLACAEDAPA